MNPPPTGQVLRQCCISPCSALQLLVGGVCASPSPGHGSTEECIYTPRPRAMTMPKGSAQVCKIC